MKIELRKVSLNEKDKLAVLVDEYLEDHCRHQQNNIGPASVEDYAYFQQYWREEGRFPFSIEVDKKRSRI